MRKLLFVFCVAWAFYSISVTGYGVAQTWWWDIIGDSPSKVQAENGNISHRGSILLNRQQRVLSSELIVFYDDPEKVSGLSLGYWLYPARITYVLNGADKTSDNNDAYPAKTIEEVVAESSQTILFIGSQQTLYSYRELLKGYGQENILEDDNGDVFVVMERL